MATTKQAPRVEDTTEILRLVETAQQQGSPDRYHGKRRWTRFTAGMQLEVTTEPTDPTGSVRVIMHNLSAGGLAFWSKRRLPERCAIFVREFSDEGQAEWIPAQVCHCALCLRGFLVGAEFENPPPTETHAHGGC